MEPSVWLDVAKQSPVLLVLVWILKRGMEEGRTFLSALREIQQESRADAKEARDTLQRVQEQTTRVLENASVALARNADATRSLESRLEQLHWSSGKQAGSD